MGGHGAGGGGRSGRCAAEDSLGRENIGCVFVFMDMLTDGYDAV